MHKLRDGYTTAVDIGTTHNFICTLCSFHIGKSIYLFTMNLGMKLAVLSFKKLYGPCYILALICAIFDLQIGKIIASYKHIPRQGADFYPWQKV